MLLNLQEKPSGNQAMKGDMAYPRVEIIKQEAELTFQPPALSYTASEILCRLHFACKTEGVIYLIRIERIALHQAFDQMGD